MAKFKIGDVLIDPRESQGDIIQITDVDSERYYFKVLEDSHCGVMSLLMTDSFNLSVVHTSYIIHKAYSTPLYAAMNTIRSTPTKKES